MNAYLTPLDHSPLLARISCSSRHTRSRLGGPDREAVLGLAFLLGSAAISVLIVRHQPVGNLAGAAFTISAAWAAGRAIRRAQVADFGAAAHIRAAGGRTRGPGAARPSPASARELRSELHAIVARSVAAMVVQAEGARSMLVDDPERADAAMGAIEDTGRQTLTEMRRILGVLRHGDDPAGREPQPGVAQIYALIQRARERGQPVELQVDGEPGTLAAGVDLGLYRILEDALDSARRQPSTHRRGHAAVSRGGSRATAHRPLPRPNAWPTDAMRERVALCDGALDDSALDEDGWQFVARMPRGLQGALDVSVRVLIADDQQLIRDGFRMILAADPDIEIVGEASNGAEAVALARELHPDVVLMDIRMPELDGIEATRRILAQNHDPRTNVLILTTFDLDEYVYDALRAGASGFLLKDVPARQLVAAIRTVGEGDALLSPSITRRLIEEFAASRAPTAPAPELDELTPRELEVFRLRRDRQDKQRDRRRADHRRDHHQDARHPHPDEARRSRPRPSRRSRIRDPPRQSRPPDKHWTK